MRQNPIEARIGETSQVNIASDAGGARMRRVLGAKPAQLASVMAV